MEGGMDGEGWMEGKDLSAVTKCLKLTNNKLTVLGSPLPHTYTPGPGGILPHTLGHPLPH